GLGTDRFRGPTRWVVNHERVIALQGYRNAVLSILQGQVLAHAALAKPHVVRQPHPLDDRPRSGRQVAVKIPTDHLHAEDAAESHGLSRFTTKGLAEVLDKRWRPVGCPNLSQLTSDTLANALVIQSGSSLQQAIAGNQAAERPSSAAAAP